MSFFHSMNIFQNLFQKVSTPHSEIAIIYRNNSSADGIEANLREFSIPAKRKGGMSFFDSVEVKFILDILVMQISITI
jgi:DNA helicase-2/ATP-dependent DNA helicase PcrA